MKLKQHQLVADDQLEAYESIRPGMVLYGYCGGYFGRDSYADKVVLEVSPTRLTAREINGNLVEASGSHRGLDWNDLVKFSNQTLAEREAEGYFDHE